MSHITLGQLWFTPHTTYHNSFFLLRIPVTVSGHLAEIGYSQSSELTLNSHCPSLSVSFHSISTNLKTVLMKYGVSHVGTFWYEHVPLFQVVFSSENGLEKFLRAQQKVQSELASLFYAKLAKHSPTATPGAPPCDIPATVQTQLFLISPDAIKKDAQVLAVTLENHSTCMTLWKESELFDFKSLFRHHLAVSKIQNEEPIPLLALLFELGDVVDWFHLGLHMNVPESELQKIEHDYQTTDEQKTRMLMKCRDLTPDLTWSAIVRALVEIKMWRLANKVALKYGVMAPVETSTSLKANRSRVAYKSTNEGLSKQIEQTVCELDVGEGGLIKVEKCLDQAKERKALAKSKYNHSRKEYVEVEKMMTVLQQERKKHRDKLASKRKELKYLRVCQEAQKENEELEHIIQEKEREIMELKVSLQEVEKNLELAKQEAQASNEKLELANKEVLEKCNDVQLLKMKTVFLENSLLHERKRIDQLLMQSVAAGVSKAAYTEEIEFQLAAAQKQSESQAQIESCKQAISRSDQQIQKLSNELQQLQRQLCETSQLDSNNPEVDDGSRSLLVEKSDLRIQLAESEGEKEELRRQLQRAEEEKLELEMVISHLISILMQTLDPQLCHANGSGVEIAVFGQQAQFEVHLADKCGDPCDTAPQSVTVELNGSTIQTSVVRKSAAIYIVSYQPSVRGQHILNVRVNDEPIMKSPFRVYVRQPPQLLCSPVRVIEGPEVVRPWRIAAGNVNVLSTRAKEGSGDMDPMGVAVDGSGFIYKTHCKSSSLWKLNPKGEVVEKANERGKFDGIGLDKHGKLFVCDYGNHRVLAFDTRKMKCIKCFGSKGSSEGMFCNPVDLSFDTDSNVYVADLCNHCVQVLSNSGKFLRTIGKYGTGPGELVCPVGVHVDHDWVYVTEWENHRISVFTTSGEFMGSFGQSDEGLRHPRGITIDDDGYVYICNTHNDCIQVF